VTAALHRGNHGQVEGVAGEIAEGAHAALAQDHVVIALGHYVFRGHQELIERGRHATLEQDRLARLTGMLQQGEVLHVARADLNNVGVPLHQFQAFVVYGLSDNPQAEFGAEVRKDLQPRLAQALKTVRGCAWFEGATTE
jgi:hypothetical protein